MKIKAVVDPEYVTKRNSLIAIASKYADDVFFAQVCNYKHNHSWSRTYLDKMRELALASGIAVSLQWEGIK